MNILKFGVLPLIARLLVSVIFVTSAISKAFSWEANVDFMTSRHMRMIPILLVAALLVESFGALCLIVGFGTRIAASVMFLYMIPVTLLLHDFMSTSFEKNLGIMGCLSMLAVYGPGKFSLSPRDRNASITP
ncbi:MAG TPA: DoxX family protein [Candidatus Acidoferrum sp.]|jgi:putative oxidoreductase